MDQNKDSSSSYFLSLGSLKYVDVASSCPLGTQLSSTTLSALSVINYHPWQQLDLDTLPSFNSFGIHITKSKWIEIVFDDSKSWFSQQLLFR